MKISATGAFFTIVFLIVVLWTLLMVKPVLEPGAFLALPHFVKSTEISAIVQDTSMLLWNERGLDVLAQAAMLLATAAGVSALFRRKEVRE
ncbi:MAG: hypothetical protein ACTSXJ_03000 [Candidatus Baldrarchaeia archaeon]